MKKIIHAASLLIHISIFSCNDTQTSAACCCLLAGTAASSAQSNALFCHYPCLNAVGVCLCTQKLHERLTYKFDKNNEFDNCLSLASGLTAGSSCLMCACSGQGTTCFCLASTLACIGAHNTIKLYEEKTNSQQINTCKRID